LDGDSPNFSSVTALLYSLQPLDYKKGSRCSRLVVTCNHIQDSVSEELFVRYMAEISQSCLTFYEIVQPLTKTAACWTVSGHPKC